MHKYVLLFVLLLTFQNGICQSLDEVLVQIESYIDNDEDKKAEKLIDKHLKENPKNADLVALKGVMYQYKGKPEEAFSHFQKAIQLDPENSKAYSCRGYFYSLLGEIENAITDLTMAIKFQTNDSIKTSMLASRAVYYMQNKQLDEALADIENAYERDSNSVGVLNNYALILDDLGRHDENIEMLKRITVLDPESHFAYLNIGFFLSSHNKYDESIVYFEKAYSLQPESSYVLNNYGFTLYKIGKKKEGVEMIEKSLKQNPANSYAYRNLALIYLESNEIEKVCENIKLALRFKFTAYYGDEVGDLEKKHCIK